MGHGGLLFWKWVFPISLGSRTEGGKNSPESTTTTITFIRFTFNADQLILAALDMFNEKSRDKFDDRTKRKDRFFINYVFGRPKYAMAQPDSPIGRGETVKSRREPDELRNGSVRLLRWGPNDIGDDAPNGHGAMHYLSFPPDVDTLVEEAGRWLESEKWYREKGITWKRGWMLFGPPGTGKTSLVRAIAQDLGMPIFVYDVASLSNEELRNNWRQMLTHAPVIALIEDLDNLFHGREAVNQEHGAMTFDALLNCMDGVERSNGVFTVLTTNRIDRLDTALGIPQLNKQGTPKLDAQGITDTISTRPGRIDRVLELTQMDAECRRRLAARVLEGCPSDEVEKAVACSEGDTGAQFQERLTRIALVYYWSQRVSAPKRELQGILPIGPQDPADVAWDNYESMKEAR